jgi:hypothetical protein
MVFRKTAEQRLLMLESIVFIKGDVACSPATRKTPKKEVMSQRQEGNEEQLMSSRMVSEKICDT